LRALAGLLVDAVESGAAVSFVLPLTVERAQEWWRRTFSASHTGAVFLVARDTEGSGEIVGTVQLQPAWAPNQPHRAEVAKLLVHRTRRGGGLGGALMRAIEKAALGAGFSLLTLDGRWHNLKRIVPQVSPLWAIPVREPRTVWHHRTYTSGLRPGKNPAPNRI